MADYSDYYGPTQAELEQQAREARAERELDPHFILDSFRARKDSMYNTVNASTCKSCWALVGGGVEDPEHLYNHLLWHAQLRMEEDA